MFVNKHFTCLGCVISKGKQCWNGKLWAYSFHVKMKIMKDFHISIKVPLIKKSLYL